MNVDDMKIMMVKNKDKGFTLAELLVVVAIIAILVAVSIVIFTGKQKEARATVCEANRTSLKHHLAADYMSGELDHLDQGGLDEYIKMDEAVCPSKGTYSITGSFENGFQIKCGFHDGDGSGGSGDESKSAVTNLIEAVEALMGETGDKSNDDIIKSFFGKAGEKYQKFVKDINMADILKNVDLKALAKQITKMNGNGDVESMEKSLEAYKNKSYKVVPYYAANGKKVVPYYVNQSSYDKLKNGKTHEQSSVCYVDGHWYFNKETNYNGTAVSSAYVMTSVDKAYKDAKEKNIKIENAMKDNGWIKVK